MNSPTEGESLGRGDLPAGDAPQPRQLPAFSRTITMAQIAKAAGVSQGAISSLLNDRDYGIRVSEKTRERVFKVCREMGYMPNDLRAMVRMYPELGEFCLLISRQLGNAAEEPALARVASAAVASVPNDVRALTISRYEAGLDYQAAPDALPQPVRVGVASKFVGFGPINPSLVTAITRRGLPFVLIGTTFAQPGVVCFVPDYAQASVLALEYLAGLGHQRIAIVSGPFGSADPAVLDQNRGVRMAFEKMGQPMESQFVVHGDLAFSAGLAAAETLFERKPRPTAVYCLTDAAAAGVVARATALGIKIPEQLSVIGCGDDPVCGFTYPALTSIHIPYEAMAAAAVAEADQLIRFDRLASHRTVVLPVHLVARASCRPVQASP
jgi:LacI family transcriptional regulator